LPDELGSLYLGQLRGDAKGIQQPGGAPQAGFGEGLFFSSRRSLLHGFVERAAALDGDTLVPSDVHDPKSEPAVIYTNMQALELGGAAIEDVGSPY
jgi:hypothetical protein